LIYAAIDIGSNAVRLLIQESKYTAENEVYFQKISLTRIPLRLGKDVFSKGKINNRSVQKLIKVFRVFKLIMEINDVAYFRACATSAMREAKNNEEIKDAIEKETSIQLEIIGGDEEAELIFLNFHLAKLNKNKNYIYIDVGGGSTEVTYIKEGQKIASRSFNIGSVRHLKGEKKNEVNKEAVNWIQQQVGKYGLVDEAIGTGGNINKIYNYSVHKMQEPLAIDQLRSIISIIEKYSYEDRIRILKLKPNRADIIIYGSNIYLTMMEAAGAKRIIVPKVGLTDGMIYQMFLNQEAEKN